MKVILYAPRRSQLHARQERPHLEACSLEGFVMSDEEEMSITCRFDLQQLTQKIQELEKGKSGRLPIVPLSPDRPRALVALFGEEARALRFTNAKLPEIVSTLLSSLQLPNTFSHLIEGGMRIAENADAGPVGLPAYHNQQHVAEVVIAAYLLGKRERLSSRHVAELLVAAAAHDIWHPGVTNSTPFEIETVSGEIASRILVEVGWKEEEIERVRSMILATDFVNGVPPTKKAYLETRHLPAHNPDRIAYSQRLALIEADVLFSCFDSDYNEELSKLLSLEWNLPTENLTLSQRLGFLNSVSFISDASKQLGLDTRRKALIADLESRKNS